MQYSHAGNAFKSSPAWLKGILRNLPLQHYRARLVQNMLVKDAFATISGSSFSISLSTLYVMQSFFLNEGASACLKPRAGVRGYRAQCKTVQFPFERDKACDLGQAMLA